MGSQVYIGLNVTKASLFDPSPHCTPSMGASFRVLLHIYNRTVERLHRESIVGDIVCVFLISTNEQGLTQWMEHL